MEFRRILERLFDTGSHPSDETEKIRLIRQVNGLNIFFMLVASSIGIYVVLFAPGSPYLYVLQFAAFVLYLTSFVVTARGGIEVSRHVTLYVFEWQLFFGNCLMNMWASPAIFIVTLYPLLAALVDVSILRHLLVALLQAGVWIVAHFAWPAVEQWIFGLSSLGESASSAIRIMSLGLIPPWPPSS